MSGEDSCDDRRARVGQTSATLARRRAADELDAATVSWPFEAAVLTLDVPVTAAEHRNLAGGGPFDTAELVAAVVRAVPVDPAAVARALIKDR